MRLWTHEHMVARAARFLLIPVFVLLGLGVIPTRDLCHRFSTRGEWCQHSPAPQHSHDGWKPASRRWVNLNPTPPFHETVCQGPRGFFFKSSERTPHPIEYAPDFRPPNNHKLKPTADWAQVLGKGLLKETRQKSDFPTISIGSKWPEISTDFQKKPKILNNHRCREFF